MLTTSDTLDKFASAMAKVQEGIGGAIKGNVNPAFKSKYADLSAVWEAWQSIGPAAGFSVMQFPGLYDPEAKAMGMDTLVMHSSGQWVRSSLSVPLGKVDAQGYGSAATYARRYSLAAAVGICPEDDDGNAASRAPARNENVGEPRISAQQCAELRKLLASAGATEDSFVDYLKCGTLPELPASRYASAKAALEKRISANAPATEREAA